MTMPRLSLYRPEKGNDYKFIDKTIWEMFQVGGTDVLVHKYIGPGSSAATTPSTPNYTSSNETQIQDLLFLENRDRRYDPDVFLLRGVYNIQDTDFNLSQFGLFLQNDTIFITFHMNDTVEKLGRKIIAGDVLELPHLKDEYALNDLQFALKRFFVIEEITRAAEGYSVTWYPHLYRAKCKPLVDSQEFKDILDAVNTDAQGNADPNGSKLRDIMSTYEREMQITQAVLDQAEADAPKSGYDTTKFYTIQKNNDGRSEILSVDSNSRLEISADLQTQATDENEIKLYDEIIWSATKTYAVGDIFSYDEVYTDQRSAKKYTIINIIPNTLEENPTPPNATYYRDDGAATAQYVGHTASTVLVNPNYKDYPGYLTADGVPPNGIPFTAGIAFPPAPVVGQYCLRTDYLPNRLFQWAGSRWSKVEDDVRMTMSNLGESDVGTGDKFEGKDVKQTLKTTFINNTLIDTIDGKSVKEKQSLSKALRPQADE